MSQANVLLSSSVSFSVSVRLHAPDARRWLYDRGGPDFAQRSRADQSLKGRLARADLSV